MGSRQVTTKGANNATLLRKYGITRDEYDAILAYQEGRCAICQRAPRAKDPGLAVDHHHRTGQVRGLLCARCNHMLLGWFGEDADAYDRAAQYLMGPPPAEYVIGYRTVPDAPPTC